MPESPEVSRIRRKYRVVAPELDERRRRQWAAAEAREVGYGGVSVVARATGLARSTIHVGLRDLQASRQRRVKAAERTRRAGGGRPPLTTSDPALLTALLALIEQRMTRAAREMAFVHLDACRMCLDLLTAVLRSLDEKTMVAAGRIR